MNKRLAGARAIQVLPGLSQPQVLPASTKQEAVWERLRGGQVGSSVVGVQQVVSACGWVSDGTPLLSVCVYCNVPFSVVLSVPLKEVLKELNTKKHVYPGGDI